MPRSRSTEPFFRGFITRLVIVVVFCATARLWLPILMWIGETGGQAYGRALVRAVQRNQAPASPAPRPANTP